MSERAFREILIFVIGTTPQIVTETLYALTEEISPPIFPDEIHLITTLHGKERLTTELIEKGRLEAFLKEYHLPSISPSRISIHVVRGGDGVALQDIQDRSHNEALANFIVEFIREKTDDMGTRLHCSLAGGRKTMSFYLGSALQLFGRPWDRLYHVLVSPEFESHPEFFYKPKKNRRLASAGPDGKRTKTLQTKDARICLAELPYLRLRGKITLEGKEFTELVMEGQREIDTALVQPTLRLNLHERTVAFGETILDLVPIQTVIYGYLLRQKLEACLFRDRPYCLDCTECFPTLADLSKRKAFEEMASDYRKIYGEFSGRVDEFQKHWEKKGGIDPETLRQNISKINGLLKEQIADERILPYVSISSVGKHGSKRYGIRAEKRKIVIESYGDKQHTS